MERHGMAATATQLALYEEIPKTSANKLERCATAIDRAHAKGIELIFEVGKQLQIAHDELANHGDGCFGKWCKERCGIDRSTAHHYRNVVEVFGKHKELICCPGQQTFDAKSLYYLSRDVTPEEAITDALKAAKKGDRITLGKAKEIVDEYVIDTEQPSEPVVTEVDDEDESLEWNSLDFDFSIRRETMRWWKACPLEERPTVPDILRRIADKMEERINGDQA
jgi:hypothetical protein